ncbi:hypothetical protein EFO71_05175 [Lacticaseibacillus rhamnosus]|nr:hypothetical protein [Lacticaseibacillus rhamnosus]MCT3177350.1 hypothetical protein [Lacticaseibacillus rhamnosus]MCT3183618.1 hypothetical protein [Lacticaseibacillus rhamnosus]MCT4447795.1 hypothetical protein [Lacticaseibacillus rhamnosus]
MLSYNNYSPLAVLCIPFHTSSFILASVRSPNPLDREDDTLIQKSIDSSEPMRMVLPDLNAFFRR